MEHKSENKICQNCKKDFTIEPDDFGFYEKIKVPPPTFCPECRLFRRLSSANERVLYKRTCDLTGKNIFSMYPENTPFPVYESEAWYSDKWDPYQYGVEYDFSKSFFEQFYELLKRVPKMALVKQGFFTNSEYNHRVHNLKNCFMVFRSSEAVDSMYLSNTNNVTDCMDCLGINNSELCYECIDCTRCYKTKFAKDSVDCRDSVFLYNCRNCSNCIGCVNLRNQEYYIWNQKYTKEEYFKKLKEMELNTHSGIKNMEKEFSDFRKKLPQEAVISVKSENVSGDEFLSCKNVLKSFECINVKDGKYLFAVYSVQDSMDYYQWGNNSELIYESMNVGINSSRISFSTQCWNGAHDLMYCDSCPSSNNCFGCVGLKKGEYAILNKRYSKEEYEVLKEKIIQQMKEIPYTDERGKVYRFGEFFPESFSFITYNESGAADFMPLTKEEVIKRGYIWKERERKNYKITKESTSIPETSLEVGDEILDEIISCEEKDSSYSVGAFRITKDELSFYKRMDLPIPRACFDVRHVRRLRKKAPLRLIKRNCSKCQTEVETVYTEEYAPILYCKECYQQEVY